MRQIRGLRLELNKALAVAKFSSQQTKNSTNRLARLFSVEREIRTAYFRTVPPTKLASTESRECLQEVIRFARTKGTVRRIIAVPNKAMAEWRKTHAEEVRAIPRHNIRVLVTVHQRVEPTSVATIDEDGEPSSELAHR